MSPHRREQEDVKQLTPVVSRSTDSIRVKKNTLSRLAKRLLFYTERNMKRRNSSTNTRRWWLLRLCKDAG
jgi:hypothetical protein